MKIKISTVFLLLFFVIIGSCNEKSEEISELFGSVAALDVNVSRFYYKDSSEAPILFAKIKSNPLHSNNRYLYVDGQNLIDGFWKLKSDTLFFSPINQDEEFCDIEYPILVLNNLKTPLLFKLPNHADDQCNIKFAYFTYYFSKVHKTIKYDNDVLMCLSLYSFELEYDNIEENQFSNQDIANIYNQFSNNKSKFTFTDICISLQHGLLMAKKNTIGYKKLPL